MLARNTALAMALARDGQGLGPGLGQVGDNWTVWGLWESDNVGSIRGESDSAETMGIEQTIGIGLCRDLWGILRAPL